MDIKLVAFQERIPKDYQLEVFNKILKYLNSKNTSFQKIFGKRMFFVDLKIEDKISGEEMHKIKITIVKNKTCYKVYTKFE